MFATDGPSRRSAAYALRTSCSGRTGAEDRREEPLIVRHYEAMYIVDPAVPDEEIEPIIQRFAQVVTDMGGNVTEAGLWEQGRRPLVYPIKGRREGTYVLMQFEAGQEVPAELDRLLRISDSILRHIIVRLDPDEE